MMKVFIGTYEVASIIKNLSLGFEALGHEVFTVLKIPNKFYDFKYSQILKKYTGGIFGIFGSLYLRLWMFFNLKKLLRKYEVFVFVWKNLTPNFSDYEYLRKKGKYIVHIFVGSDIRSKIAYCQQYDFDQNLYWGFESNKDFNRKLEYLRQSELFGDYIQSVPDQSGLQIKPFDHLFLPIELPLKKFKIEAPNSPIRIIHAPSKRSLKGTEKILEIIENVKCDGYKFEFHLIENLNNDELLNLLSKSDVLVDQLYLNGPGVLGHEAMARGCLVLTKTDSSNKHVYNPPVVSIDEESLKDKLIEVLDNFSSYDSLKEKAYEFVKHNNERSIVAQSLLDGLNKNTFDYKPDFFINELELPKEIKVTQANWKLTKQVIEKFR